MNNQKRNHSNVLMVVGVIFILMAGGVCVSKAWNYFPLVVKQGCLFGIAMFGLSSSFVLVCKNRLHKTESALFYIGNAFLGYFFLSVMDSAYSGDGCGTWEKSYIISLVLLIPVAIRLAVKKSIVEFVVGAVLLNWLMFSGYSLMEVGNSVCACMFALAGLIVCGISYVMKDYFRESNVSGDVMRIILFAQEAVVCYQLLFSVLFVSGTESIGEKICLGVALFEGIALAIYMFMQLEEEAMQSVQFWIIVMLILILVCYNNVLESDLIVTIVSSVTCVALMIWAEWQKQRKFILVAGLALASILLYATRAIWLSIAWWVYMMVAGVTMVGIAIWREKRAETKEGEDKQEG